MIRPLFCTLVGLCVQTMAICQNNSCPNVDLAQNNFNNWTGYTGSYYSPGNTFGIVNGRHTILNQQATDPNTCNQLSVIPPGHTRSVKLGNSNIGAQAEQLIYSIQVTPQSNLFIYKYAVVLENPGHPIVQQPKFETKILNSLGMPVGGGCGTYTVYGGQPGQNFQQCGSRTWLPWTTVGLDLTPYIGQTIQIEFTTWDCAQGAHFGYAYIAAECLPLTIDVNYCGGNQPLILTAPSGFQSYNWQPGNLTGQQVTINNPSLNQNYICTMTTYSNQGTCSVNLGVQASPTLVQSQFQYSTGCQNTPMLFQANSSVSTNDPNVTLTYQWNFGNSSPAMANGINASTQFSSAGNQWVSLITQSSNGCVDTLTQTINVLPIPHLTPIFDANCINQQTAFALSNYSGVQHVSWNYNDGSPLDTGFNTQHTFNQPGIYNIATVGIATNGCSDTVISPLTLLALPPIFAGNDTIICPGNNIILNAQGGTNYQWSNGLVQGQNVPITQPAILYVSGIDTNHCWANDSLFVNLYGIDSVQAMPDDGFCFGDSISLQATAYTGIWWENGFNPNQWVSPSVGNSTYIVHGSDNHGCHSTDTLILTVYPLPLVFAGNDTTVCLGSSMLLNALGASTYSWSNQSNNNSLITINGNLNLVVMGTDNMGCQESDSLHIGIDSIPIVAFEAFPSQGCAPLEVQLINQSIGNTFIDYTWEFTNGSMAIGDSSTLWFTQVGCYDAQFTVMSTLGCTYSTIQQNAICTYPVPIAAFNNPNSSLSTIYNAGTFSNLSQGANSFLWNFGDGSTNDFEENPYHEFPILEGGTYPITLIATNAYGCSDTAFQQIIITDELAFYIPNAFTPDGDQFNNVWKPVFSDINDPQNYRAMIYNRWGEILWESYNPQVGWDGTYGDKGIPVQDDIYIYEVSFGYKNNAKKERVTGHIAVLR